MGILVVGCGDVGARVGVRHLQLGDEVTGVVRSADSAARIVRAGIHALRADLDAADFTLPDVAFDLVYHFAPPPASGVTDPRTAALLAALRPCGKLVYISTTAVYGDQRNAWIDETTPPAPGTDRGRRRLDAEEQVRAWGARHRVATVVLRVAAIWGPDRPVRNARRAGADAAWVNRIHVDDLADVCVAAGARAPDGAVYDCADGAPTRTGHMDESKRVRARRIRDELGVMPRRPG